MAGEAWATLLARYIGAVGAVAVAVLAIWGDWFRFKLLRPPLDLHVRTPVGHFTTAGDMPAFYCHLTVTNRRPWTPARGARVLCTRILRKSSPDCTWKEEPDFLPVALSRAFPAVDPVPTDIVTEDIYTLGYVKKSGGGFWLTPTFFPNNFPGWVRENEAIRVHLVIHAANYSSLRPHVVEIAWDGNWSDQLGEMLQHLTVKLVPDTEP
jgi:hypothetical protein